MIGSNEPFTDPLNPIVVVIDMFNFIRNSVEFGKSVEAVNIITTAFNSQQFSVDRVEQKFMLIDFPVLNIEMHVYLSSRKDGLFELSLFNQGANISLKLSQRDHDFVLSCLDVALSSNPNALEVSA